jgi:hypothetical protein
MKLIKTEDEQGVMYSLSGDNLPDNYVLSKQNCEEEFAKAMGIVDVEKLAYHLSNEEYSYETHLKSAVAPLKIGFKKGFNKAMELNKDKVFTLEDMTKAIEMARQEIIGVIGRSPLFSDNEIIQSLQKLTEIEVEIITDKSLIGQCDCPCHTNKGIRHIMACCNPKRVETPKLDNKGRLILKII